MMTLGKPLKMIEETREVGKCRVEKSGERKKNPFKGKNWDFY